MKPLVLKILGLFLIFSVVTACSDDDDDPPVINDIMMVYDSETGLFSSIDISDGSLVALGSVTYQGEILAGLRDIVFNPNNDLIYASARANSDTHNGAIFSIDPTTLVATMINSNEDDDWYAVPGIEIYNNQILGTVYWDEYDNANNLDYNTGLITLNLDGSFVSETPLMDGNETVHFSDGMGIEYAVTGDELLVTDYDEIIVTDFQGDVKEVIDLDEINFPFEESLDGIRTIKRSEDGVLYGIDRDNHFGRINLTVGSPVGSFTYIATLPESGRYVGLTLIPENIFE
jgi:hypothetical protein